MTNDGDMVFGVIALVVIICIAFVVYEWIPIFHPKLETTPYSGPDTHNLDYDAVNDLRPL